MGCDMGLRCFGGVLDWIIHVFLGGWFDHFYPALTFGSMECGMVTYRVSVFFLFFFRF